MSKRVVIGGLLLVVVVLIAGGVFLLSSLDSIVKRAIEQEGSRVVGAPVSVESVSIALSEGRGSIRGLRVGNPEGFGEGDVLELDEIELDLDIGSLQEPPIRLQRLGFERTTVNLAIDDSGRTNLDAIVRKAREAPAAEPGEDASGEPTRIAIDRLDFAGGTVVFARPGAEARRFDFPGFQRKGLGGAQGAPPGEIAATLVQSLARQVASTAASDQLRKLVEDRVGGDLEEKAGSLLKGLVGGKE